MNILKLCVRKHTTGDVHMGNMKRIFAKLASYLSNFLSNLAVVGIGLAIFKADEAFSASLIAILALVLGAVITYIYEGGNDK